MLDLPALEADRLDRQARLETRLGPAQRNRLGYHATPPALARAMLELAAGYLGGRRVRFLDPAVGTGAFFSAALEVLGPRRLRGALGFELDTETAAAAASVWAPHGLEVARGDFCAAAPPAAERDRADLLVCNPPYVRHHHVPAAEKRRLAAQARAAGVPLSGLAGLYAYFMVLADAWMRRGAVAVWIVPAELLETNYGEALRAYLARRVTLLRVHRFDGGDGQFPGALVSSAIIALRKAGPPPEHAAVFSRGGAPAAPAASRAVAQARLDPRRKWDAPWRAPAAAAASGPTLGDLFRVRRGLATGANAFFVLDRAEALRLGLPPRFLRPVLPPPRAVPEDELRRGPDGFPAGLPQRVVLDCGLDRAAVRARYPALERYLRAGERRGIAGRYLPRHREPWYAQEHRPPAPLLCTYMGRRSGGRFIRFIRNRSEATATNVYHLLYPAPRLAAALAGRPGLLDEIAARLRGLDETVEAAGRSYGGGLVKVEPKELESVVVPDDVLAPAQP